MDLPTEMLTKTWILPLIMAGSFLLILFVGKRLPEKARASIGIVAVGACFVLSLIAAAGWIQRVDDPDAQPIACGDERYQEPILAGVAEEGHGEEGDHGEEGGSGEDGTHDEAAAAPLALAPGESAAALPVAEEGEEEHHSTTPVVCAWTWFETGLGDWTEEYPATEAHGEGEAALATASLAAVGQDGGEGEEPLVIAPGPDGLEEGELAPTPVMAEVESSGAGLFEFGFITDGLSVMMLITVSFISLLVHIYSTEYLHGDVRHTHYYAFLSLFTASMLFYVLSSNTLQMLVGWELVGVCSFALIGHWWEEKPNSDAALKAFLTNRVGDTGLIIGVVITFFAAGATSFNVLHINEYALSGAANQTLLLIGALCLFAGVTSKSGQFPLHTWLPDAMAGPTPVSALIHAATMVVAGVYLIARLYGVFFEGLNIQFNSINYVALIGGITVVGGALLAFVQQDLKKVLAYSTISQLGYMVMALGVGAWTAAIFHLFTHAFFKACLFLGAGSVSHACHHTFDMRKMGGLRKHMPTTFWTFTLATLALIGIFPFAGFWSKDEILAGASQGQEQAYTFMLILGVVGAFCTAAYMTRAWWKTFFGEYRGHGTPHESPKVMTVPLIVLAVAACFFGLLNFPDTDFFLLSWWPNDLTLRFEHYVEPTFAFPTEFEHPEFSWWVALSSTVIGVIGVGLAYQFFALGKGPFRGLSKRQPFAWAYKALENKYWLDVLYTDKIAGGTKGPVAKGANWLNQHVIDKVVNVVGASAARAGNLTYKYVDQGVVDTVVNASGAASEESGQLLRKVQTGKVQQYAALLFGGALIFAFVLVLFV